MNDMDVQEMDEAGSLLVGILRIVPKPDYGAAPAAAAIAKVLQD